MPARTGITAGTYGTLTSITLLDLLNRLKLQGRFEEPAATSEVKGSTEAHS